MFFKMTELRSALSEIQTFGLESLSTETQKSENFKYSVKTLTLCQTQTVSFNIVFLSFFTFFYVYFLSIYFLLDWIWGVLFMFRNIDIDTYILLIISYYRWCDCLLPLHHGHNSPLQRSRKIRIVFSQYSYNTPYTYDKTQYPYCIIYTQSELSSRLAVLKAKCSKSRIMPETTRPNTVTSSGKTSSSSYQVTAVLHTLIVTIIMIIIIIVIIIIIIIIITITIIIIIVIIIT